MWPDYSRDRPPSAELMWWNYRLCQAWRSVVESKSIWSNFPFLWHFAALIFVLLPERSTGECKLFPYYFNLTFPFFLISKCNRGYQHLFVSYTCTHYIYTLYIHIIYTHYIHIHIHTYIYIYIYMLTSQIYVFSNELIFQTTVPIIFHLH